MLIYIFFLRPALSERVVCLARTHYRYYHILRLKYAAKQGKTWDSCCFVHALSPLTSTVFGCALRTINRHLLIYLPLAVSKLEISLRFFASFAFAQMPITIFLCCFFFVHK